MLLLNQIALEMTAAGEPLITGYPDGPANLPINMFGPWKEVRGGACPGTCRVGFLNATRGKYWFTHKPAKLWVALYREWFPCNASLGQPLVIRGRMG